MSELSTGYEPKVTMRIAQFDGLNFPTWKFKMTNYLDSLGLLPLVECETDAKAKTRIAEEEGKEIKDDQEFKLRKKKAYSILTTSMASQVRLVQSINRGEAHKVW